jgi:hypothetical protein
MGRPRTSGASGEDAMRVVAIRRKAGDSRPARAIIAEAFPDHDEDASWKAYTRAKRVYHIHDRWISFVRQWAGRQWDSKPEAAPDFVEDFIKVAGPNRAKRLGELFDHLARQWASPGQKLTWLRMYRDRMAADPLYWPQLRPTRTTGSDGDAAKLMAVMKRNTKRHWTVREIAEQFGWTIYHADNLTTEMRVRRWIVQIDQGRGLLGLPRPGLEVKKSVSQRIIEKLIADQEIGFAAMEGMIGQNIRAQLHNLRKGGIVGPGSPLKLSAAALDKIANGQPLRNGRRTLWAPETAAESRKS